MITRLTLKHQRGLTRGKRTSCQKPNHCLTTDSRFLSVSQLAVAGGGSFTYPFVATEHRLGLLLQDGKGDAAGTVEVAAFTELDGELGAAELSGEVISSK